MVRFVIDTVVNGVAHPPHIKRLFRDSNLEITSASLVDQIIGTHYKFSVVSCRILPLRLEIRFSTLISPI